VFFHINTDISIKSPGRYILSDIANWIGSGQRTPSPLPSANSNNSVNFNANYNGNISNSSSHSYMSGGGEWGVVYFVIDCF
jgi:hypothetical protein